jgi:hypothetical protein
MTPIHKHDCEACIYVGSFTKVRYSREHDDERQVQHDCYVCPSKPVNLIVRFGDMGEYSSNMAFLPQSDSMRRAYDLAMGSEAVDGHLKGALRSVRMGVYSDKLTDLVMFIKPGDDQLVYEFITDLRFGAQDSRTAPLTLTGD